MLGDCNSAICSYHKRSGGRNVKRARTRATGPTCIEQWFSAYVDPFIRAASQWRHLQSLEVIRPSSEGDEKTRDLHWINIPVHHLSDDFLHLGLVSDSLVRIRWKYALAFCKILQEVSTSIRQN